MGYVPSATWFLSPGFVTWFLGFDLLPAHRAGSTMFEECVDGIEPDFNGSFETLVTLHKWWFRINHRAFCPNSLKHRSFHRIAQR